MVLTSMRTGSTWLTYLVRHLLGRNAGFAQDFKTVEKIWRSHGIVKAHKFTPERIFKKYPDAYIVTSVRNPKGRNASQLYFKPPHTEERLESILQASLKLGERKQLNRMWEGFSSRNFDGSEMPPHYLWTTYEWMREDIFREVEILANFFGVKRTPAEISRIISKAQKESKKYGVYRKAKVDGWKEEKFADKLLVLDKYQEMYYNIVNQEIT